MHRLLYPILMTLIPRILPQVLRYLKLMWKLTLDRRVNIILRALIPLALVYVISPIDLVRDRLPFGIGRACVFHYFQNIKSKREHNYF